MENLEANCSELVAFRQNIYKLRNENHLSTKEMAKLLEISEIDLITLESGEMPEELDVNIILRIYQVFGIRPSEQFTLIK